MRFIRISQSLLVALVALAACTTDFTEQTLLAAPPKPACSAPAVETTSGRVCGLRAAGDSAIHAYLGIPYAQPTSGANRWTPPKPAGRSTGASQMTAFGPVCPQSPKLTPFPQSEDCLSLNVWTPATGGRRPVMVFIHGGAFVFGSSSNPVYDGSRLAARGDVVVVTLNYRLGALGFLAGIEGLEGNYGFLDQQLALRWVRDNIAAFGGDPSRVTLFGESAGAASVGLHLLSPDSRALFRAAIMESNPYGLPMKSMDEAERFGKRFRSALGCRQRDLACMRDRPFQAVVRHESSAGLKIASVFAGFSGQLVWSPVVDGTVVSGQPNQGAIAKPAIIGSNRDEGVIFANFGKKGLLGGKRMSRAEYRLVLDLLFSRRTAKEIVALSRYAPIDGNNTVPLSQVLTDYVFTCANRHVMGRAKGPVYGYEFTHVPSWDVWPEQPLCAPDQQKVCHTFELPFVFGNPTTVTVQKPPAQVSFTPAEARLSRSLADYWTGFATRLTPNGAGVPSWPRYSASRPSLLELSERIRPTTDSASMCDFWDTIGYDVPGLYDRMHENR